MRSLGLVAVGLAAYTSHAKPPLGYLATLGPSPLRFELPSTLGPFPLPGFKSDSGQASAPVVEPSSTALNPPPAPNQADPPGPLRADGVIGPIFGQAPFLTNAPHAGVADAKASPLVSPQMLLHFFTDPSFTNRTAVTLPMNFSPASPPPTQSSSATYISAPKP
ncbi:MAG: hypothetical protein U1G07_01350 [Verrucomicrobiota bacterium]